MKNLLEENWHAIEGPNGQCACGPEKGGCGERLAAFIATLHPQPLKCCGAGESGVPACAECGALPDEKCVHQVGRNAAVAANLRAFADRYDPKDTHGRYTDRGMAEVLREAASLLDSQSVACNQQEGA